MESIALMDKARIRALKMTPTLMTGTAEAPRWLWDCAYKFLVINGVLVIAPIADHQDLYAAFMTWADPVEEAKEKAARILEELKTSAVKLGAYGSSSCVVTAAGSIDANGIVNKWISTGFNVQTPMRMQQEIQDTVTALFQSGKLQIV